MPPSDRLDNGLTTSSPAMHKRPERWLWARLRPAPLVIALTYLCNTARAAVDQFPVVVPFEVGDAEFASGDNITITSVRGTKDRIMTGETYCVEGTYTLASKDQAAVSLFATTTDPTPTPVDPAQTINVSKGAGTFRLIKTMASDGYLHVSFYPVKSGSAFGGVYFGQGPWVLRNRNWSYLEKRPAERVRLSGANQKLFEYLGEPVPAPANLEQAYTATGMSNLIQVAAQRAGVTLKKVLVDDSEFPPVVGVVSSQDAYTRLMEEIKKMPYFEDQGSVGSHECHAMNIIPWRAFPAGTSQRIGHRLTVRQQMLHERLTRGVD